MGSGTPAAATVTTIDASGVATATTFEPDGDTAAGDTAAIGYTAAEGLILTGQGSTSDITLKNDVDATVFTVPTGTDDILFPDSAKAMFGAGSDLQIYHNGSNSYIDDTGTGNLYIRGSDTVRLQSATGEQGVIVTTDGAVTLYHNNGAKIATASTGVTITGVAHVSGATTSSGVLITNSTSSQNIGTIANHATWQATGSSDDFVVSGYGARSLILGTNGAEQARIASDGRIGIGTTDTTARVNLWFNSAYYGIIFQNVAGNTGALNILRFNNSAGTQQGLVSHNGSGTTTYGTSSDYRLKENVEYNWNATPELKKLKPAKFNFIADPSKTVEGFLAHEVEDIVPLAVVGKKDAVNKNGSVDPQSIDQSKLVPMLVKTILELEARITALEG